MPKKRTRGQPAEPQLTWLPYYDLVLGNTKKFPVLTNTHVVGMRMGKNTRASDILGSRHTRQRRTHTSPLRAAQ